MENCNRICRFCFNKCDRNFEAIEEITIGILEILLIKMNVVVSEEPVMCRNCAEIIQRSFEFKSICLYAQNYVVSFVNEKDNSKLDQREIYLCKKGHENIKVSKDSMVCGFCTSLLKSPFLSLDNEDEDVTLVKMMLKKCFPELDLSVIEHPVICTPCHGSLQTYFEFIENCLIIEEKLKECRFEVNSKGLTKLNDILQFTSKNISVCKSDGNKTDIFKIEQNSYLGKENAREEVEEESDHFMEEEDQKLLLIDEIEIKTEQHDFDSLQSGVILSHSKINSKFFKLEYVEPNPYRNDILTHKDNLEVIMYQCESCPYQAKTKGKLRSHMLTHKNSSEVTMYQCQSCPYQTKRKSDVNRHMVSHKDRLEETMYQCESCSYQAKTKGKLNRHILIHKNPSEVTMYQCEFCPCQTKRKWDLNRHMLTHKDPLEVTMYQCESCPYQAKTKGKLRSHILTHKNPSEVTMYQCQSCPYQTKRKSDVNRHMLSHKDRSEVTMYQCQYCSYSSKFEQDLNKHILAHKNPLETIMYQCASCSFQTKYKNNLQTHIRFIHSEIGRYRCESCSFQTKYKWCIKKHILIHKDSSEVTMYRCQTCSFQTKHKDGLQHHNNNIHKNPSDVTMYQCEICSYQTKYKYCLKRHMLIHKDLSEKIM